MSEEKTKILYIVTKSDLGGVSKYLLEIVRGLEEFIEPYFVMSTPGYFSDELIKLGYENNIFFVPMTNSIFDLPLHIKSNLQTIKIIRKIKPDLIHCNSTTGGIVGRICGALMRVPVIFTAHGWAFTEGVPKAKRNFYKFLERFLAHFTRKIICVSDYDRKLALKVMPEAKDKLYTIHNGISDIDDKYRKKNFSEDKLKIVMISRFCAQKDPYTLIQAVNDLHKEGFNIKLNIYGYGEEKDKVLKEIASCENPNIQFCGVAENISEILEQNDIYALISNWEGLPIGIIEGMRSGMPIIACNVGGNSELIKNGENGFIIGRKNKEQLKEKIKVLIENKELILSMAQKSRELYKKKFCMEIVYKNTINIYCEILKSQNGEVS